MLRFANGLGQLVRGTASSKLLKWEEALRIDESQSTIALIKEEYGVYVDKTSHLARLVTQHPKKAHIAVSRRFGKSSTMGMVGDLYRPGAKDLFKDTKICHNGFFKDWQPHPITTFDFSNSFDAPTLEDEVFNTIARWAQIYEVNITQKTIPAQMTALLNGIKDNTGKRVVVLVDEYDIPIMKGGPACSDALDGFYGAIKASKVLRQMLMFGTFNKYRTIGTCTNDTTDLSSDPGTLALFGFTEAEVRDVMLKIEAGDANYYDTLAQSIPGVSEATTPEAKRNLVLNDYYNRFAKSVPEVKNATSPEAKRDLVLKMMKNYYDGFILGDTCEPVYNPYSVLQARKFAAITKYFANTEVIPELEVLSLKQPFITFGAQEIAMTGDIASVGGQNLNPAYSETIKQMWNIGLLTLKELVAAKYDDKGVYIDQKFELKLPNAEVTKALQTIALDKLIATADDQILFATVITHAKAKNFRDMASALQKALSKEKRSFIFKELHLKHHLRENFAKLGATAKPDQDCTFSTAVMDLRVEIGARVFIFELKYGGYTVNDAVNQIIQKKYCLDDLKKGLEVYGVGVAFFGHKESEIRIVSTTLGSADIDYEEKGEARS